MAQKRTVSNNSNSIYFNDGTRKIDFVLVYEKVIQKDPEKNALLAAYLTGIRDSGMQLEQEAGMVLKDHLCYKIHAPRSVLDNYATNEQISLSRDNPHYKHKRKAKFKWMTDILTKPDPQGPLFDRAQNTLSGQQPTDYTNAERILIVEKILSQVEFGKKRTDYGYQELIIRKVILAAYPLHDSTDKWTEDGPLSDRQLLARFWASYKYFYKEQPIYLIERYYGSEVAFYFAWLGFYSKILLPAVIMGIICFVIGGIFYAAEGTYIVDDEICQSNKSLCPICPSTKYSNCGFGNLSNSCSLLHLSNIMDNPATTFYAIAMSFWGVIFMAKWKRRQAMYRLRWNLSQVSVDRTKRMEFKRANLQIKVSSITGMDEYYVPRKRKFRAKVLAVSVAILLMFAIIIAMFTVMLCRFYLLHYEHISKDDFLRSHVGIIEPFSSSILTFTLSCILNMVCTFSARKLTDNELPSTELEYERLHMLKIVLFSFTNEYAPVIYLAFFKGHFYTHPGDVSQWTFFGLIKTDICKPSGCFIDISIQIFVTMVLNNAYRHISQLLHPFGMIIWKKFKFKKSLVNLESNFQWENDFFLIQTQRDFLYMEYEPIVMQYGYVALFAAALPIAPLLALLNNIFEIRSDALKITKNYRRPIPRKVQGIEAWKSVLLVLTIFGSVSSSVVVAFSSNFLPRAIYRYNHDNSLEGYFETTISIFDVKDYPKQFSTSSSEEVDTCYYFGNRNAPDHHRPYELSTTYWKNMVIRCIFFIILENICLLLSLLLHYAIPPIPRKIQLKMEHEERMLRQMKKPTSSNV